MLGTRMAGLPDCRPLLADPDDLTLVFQPIVDLAGATVAGYEALARFPGAAGPDVWFAAAAEAGVAAELEALAIHKALAAVPALLQPAECEAAVRALADDLEGLDRGSRIDEALRKIAATMACHAAVKANYPLTLEQMRYILEELRRTAYSSVCPHGRPVVLRITRREVEKNFQRI